MAEMIRPARPAALAPEFDDFLFAAIGEDRNGMPLSVVSALARLDVDPWQEAASLARLPETTATRRLASLIASLPDRPSAHLDPETIAARLIARLPHPAGDTGSAEMLLGVGVSTAMQSPPFRYIALALMVVVLGGLGMAAASQRPAPRVHNADTPVSGTIIPPVSAPRTGL